MISLSRLIKSRWANPVNENQKVISIRMLQHNVNNETEVYQYDEEKEKIMNEARQIAGKFVQEAEQKAQEIRQQIMLDKEAWEQERQSYIEAAKREGFELGLLEGRDQGYKEYQETIFLAKEVVNSSKKEYEQQVQSAEKTILNLGLKIAGQIIGQRIEETNQTFLSIVKRALKEAREYKEVQLHINPSHYGFILSQKEELLTIFPNEADFYIYPNEELGTNSCIIESANGRIDASLDSQLIEVKGKLLEILESEME